LSPRGQGPVTTRPPRGPSGNADRRLRRIDSDAAGEVLRSRAGILQRCRPMARQGYDLLR